MQHFLNLPPPAEVCETSPGDLQVNQTKRSVRNVRKERMYSSTQKKTCNTIFLFFFTVFFF